MTGIVTNKVAKKLLFLGMPYMLKFILFSLISCIGLYSQDPEDVMYVKNFSINYAGGVTFSQVDFVRKEFLEEIQKLKGTSIIL